MSLRLVLTNEVNLMPWTRKQVRLLLSKASPLSAKQKAKMKGELHDNPKLGHVRKGSKALKKF
jgi:hypothetical protein